MSDQAPVPTYTLTSEIRINGETSGMCGLCGTLVLDFDLHTALHREQWEAFNAWAIAIDRRAWHR